MDTDDIDAEALSPVRAYECVRGFARLRGPAAMRLALHAALPQVLEDQLLHVLRLNFVDARRDGGVLEADVLFAPFCVELGNGYFRFDPHARLLLLRQLDPSYPGERIERSVQVADFLVQHLDREQRGRRCAGDALYRNWIEVERWNALAFADPASTAEQLAAALQSNLTAADTSARLRIGTLAGVLATPLAQHHRLLSYAAGVQALAARDNSNAELLLRRAGDDDWREGGVLLPGARKLLRPTRAAAAPTEPPPATMPATTPVATPVTTPVAAPVSAVEPAPPRPTPSRLPTSGNCEYTAYISYAHADDQVWFNWVSHFRVELERSLRSALRGVHLPPMLLSGETGLVAGQLAEELRHRVQSSFAMIVVVHDNYALSDWCLKEVEYFHSLFGEQGVRERLYVVAMSEPAMLSTVGSAAWQRLFPHGEQVWIPFFDASDTSRPVDLYVGPNLVSPQFRRPLDRLRDELSQRLRAAHFDTAEMWARYGKPRETQPTSAGATTTAPDRGAGAGAGVPTRGPRIYIESNRHERSLWEHLGRRLEKRWAGLSEAAPPLRCRGLPIAEIDQYRTLADADGVILLWGRKDGGALLAQIHRIEDMLGFDREPVPGIVAYLMPPQHSAEPVPAWGWPVVRFDASDEERIDVVGEERDELDAFLRSVMVRWLAAEGHAEPT